MKIKLDDMELISRIDEGGTVKEIRSIRNLTISGRRRIVELEIPGSKTNVFQDLGKQPLRIVIEGEIIGQETTDTLQGFKAKFEEGKPLPFATDIVTIASLSEIVIEDFSIIYDNSMPLGNAYTITLREHTPVTGPGETTPPNQEEEAKTEIENRTKEIRNYIKNKKSG
jgi:hypothetical protein